MYILYTVQQAGIVVNAATLITKLKRMELVDFCYRIEKKLSEFFIFTSQILSNNLADFLNFYFFLTNSILFSIA